MKNIGRKRLNKIIEEEVTNHILAESNMRVVQALTNRVTRAVLQLIKNKATNEDYQILEIGDLIDDGDLQDKTTIYNLDIDFLPGKIDPELKGDDFEEDQTYLSVSLFVTPNKNVHVSGDDIHRAGNPGIHISVNAPQLPTGEDWSLLRAEISNTARHEIEHVLQELPIRYEGEHEYSDFMVTGTPVSPRAESYYLDPKEVSAHIMGYAHNANSLKELENEIRLMLKNWARKDWQKDPRQFIALEDVDIIADAWVDWAKKHLRGQRFKQ